MTNQHNLVIQGNLNPVAHAYVGATANLGGLVNNGSTSVEAGATLNVTNDIANLPAGQSLSVGGTINSGGNSRTLTGLASIAGSLGFANGESNTITPTGGTLTLSGSLSADPLFGTTESLYGVASGVTINGALVLTGSARIETSNGGSLAVTDGVTDIPAGASISVQGQFSPVDLATIEGSLVLAPGPPGSDEAGSFTTTPAAGTVTVSGNLSLSGSGGPGGEAFGTVNGRLVVANGGTVTVGPLSFLGMTNGIVNNGTITVAAGPPNAPGAGMLTAGGDLVNSNNALLTVGSGAFVGSRNLTNGGTITTGSFITGSSSAPPGSLSNEGTLAELLFAHPASGNTCIGNNDCGIIDVDSAILGGTLDPILENGFDPTNGESFIFLIATSITGQFSSIEDLNFNNDTQYWVVTYGSNFVELTAEPVPESATMLLFGIGLAALGMFARFRKRRSQ